MGLSRRTIGQCDHSLRVASSKDREILDSETSASSLVHATGRLMKSNLDYFGAKQVTRSLLLPDLGVSGHSAIHDYHLRCVAANTKIIIVDKNQ